MDVLPTLQDLDSGKYVPYEEFLTLFAGQLQFVCDPVFQLGTAPITGTHMGNTGGTDGVRIDKLGDVCIDGVCIECNDEFNNPIGARDGARDGA